MSEKIDLSELKEKWPSAVVVRTKVAEFTGGIIPRGSMANIDSRGEGPPRFNVGSKIVAYKVDDFVPWLESYIERKNAKAPRRIRGRAGQ